MSFNARRQALSLETRTHTHPLLSFVFFFFWHSWGAMWSFSHTRGCGWKTTTPPSTEHPLKHTKQPLESIGRARVGYSYPWCVSDRYRSNQRLTGAIGEQGTRWHTPTAPHPPHTDAGGNDSSPKPDSKAKPNAHSAEPPSPGTHTTSHHPPKPTTSHPSAGEDSTPSTTGKSSAEHATEAKAIAANQTFDSNNKPQKS